MTPEVLVGDMARPRYMRSSQQLLPLETGSRSEVVVDAAELDQVLTAKLLAEASEGVTTIAIELASLYDGWVTQRVAPESIAWLRGVLERLGWWQCTPSSA